MAYENSNGRTNSAAGMNVLGVGILGALVGAAAILFSHEPTRKRFKKSVDNFITEIDEKKDEVIEQAQEEVDKGKRTLARKLDETKNRLEAESRPTNRRA